MDNTHWLNLQKVKRGLKCELLARTVHLYDEVDSTQRKAEELAWKGAEEGTIVVARRQTGGRGRLGRRWFSPEGGIYLSIILRPKIPPTKLQLLTLAAGIAVAEAVREMFNVEAKLKWPNDVLVGGMKLGGVITEAAVVGEEVKHAVVGIGVNVNNDFSEAPNEVKSVATSLRLLGGAPLEEAKLLRAMMEKFEKNYRELLGENYDRILQKWRTLSDTLGRRVVVVDSTRCEGVALDIDEGGFLLVEKNGSKEVVRVLSGDVSVKVKEP